MKKVLIICFMLFMTIYTGGCNMKKSLKYEIKFYKSEHSGFQNSFYHSDNSCSDTGYCPTTSIMIKSYEELKQVCDEYNSPAFSKDSKKYDSEVNNLIRSFDSSYFNDKSLIICFGTGATGGILGKIKNITIEENTLLINYEKKDADESITAIINDPWVLIIEVNKQDVKDVSQVKLIKK